MTSSSNIPLPQIALPGQPLGLLSSYIPGPGTHLPPSVIPSPSPSSVIRASILGPTITTPPLKKGLPKLSISRQEAENQQTQTTLLPKEGSIVLGRVTRINIREARVQILVINDVPTMEEFTGVIRVQDVRATEKDRVKIYSSFRPGDIVRAEVISLGDQQSYYLSTAKNELGVLFARSQVGELMYPINWREMKCPRTGEVEERKTAKPI